MKASRRKFLFTSGSILTGLAFVPIRGEVSGYKSIYSTNQSIADLLTQWAYLAKWRCIHGFAAGMHSCTMRAMSKKVCS
jgi:hypothetical protein